MNSFLELTGPAVIIDKQQNLDSKQIALLTERKHLEMEKKNLELEKKLFEMEKKLLAEENQRKLRAEIKQLAGNTGESSENKSAECGQQEQPKQVEREVAQPFAYSYAQKMAMRETEEIQEKWAERAEKWRRDRVLEELLAINERRNNKSTRSGWFWG
ncbi:MAG: hypothetical protein Q9170_005287 [Blastenia crenularia]